MHDGTRNAVGLLAALAIALSCAATANAGERRVAFQGSSLYVHDHPGTEPAIVLMHGFPDNTHLYDRLVPELRGRRVVTFDFLGWGRSGRPTGHEYTFAEQARQLDTVVRVLDLDRIIPVAHDGSGPAAINWSLDHRDRVAALVLLNSFYGAAPTLNAPEAIRLYSEPQYTDLARALAGNVRVNRWLFRWQVGRFMSDPDVRRRTLDRLWPGFRRSVKAFASLNRDLIPAVAENTSRLAEAAAFDRPVRIVFGARDEYLNPGVARDFDALFPRSDLFLLPARHYVQVDRPADVARLIRTVPTAP